MELARKLDEHGKGAWICVMVLSFIIFWPAGLAILGYLIWSGRMKCWKAAHMGRVCGVGRWHNQRGRHDHQSNGSDGAGRYYEGSSGNSAFDDYREETLKRLEDEQIEFEGFLERLRHAKDKAEFDQFMDDRQPSPAEDPSPNNEDNRPAT